MRLTSNKKYIDRKYELIREYRIIVHEKHTAFRTEICIVFFKIISLNIIIIVN